MVYVILFILFYLLSNAYLTLDEETLIILASIIWLDAAGVVFKKLLDEELVLRVNGIRLKFIWFLEVKRQLVFSLIRLHKSRVSLKHDLRFVNNLFFFRLILESISTFLLGVTIRRKFDSKVRVVDFGIMVHYDRLIIRLGKDSAYSSFSETLVGVEKSYRRRFNIARYTTVLFLFV
jgi:hypothetical protein